MRIALVCLAFVVLAPALSAAAQQTPRAPTPEATEAEPEPAVSPRYLSALRDELAAMRVRDARCEPTDAERATCTFASRGITTGREFAVHLVYSDRTDTVYLYVERYLVAPARDQNTPRLLTRLMELNWALLLGKFEWNPTDGEVRLAMVLNTDSNFDRRAFRSAVRGIGQLADRYFGELDRLYRGQTP